MKKRRRSKPTEKHWLFTKVWGSEGKPDPFWSTITDEEFSQILKNDGCLPPELKARFCRAHEINNPPPGPFQIQVCKEDIDRLIQQIVEKGGL